MFDKVTEQLQKSMKPMSELASLNAKAFELLMEKQSSLMSQLMNDGVSFGEGFYKQKDMSAMVEAQKNYLSDLQEVFTTTAKESYEVIASTQEKAGEIIKSAVEDAQASLSAAAKAN